MMTGSHRVDADDAGTRSTLVLTMSGPLAPVLGRMLAPLMRRVLRTENGCFAERAQAQAHRTPHGG